MSQKCKLSKKGSPGEIWTGFRSSRPQIFFKIGVLKIPKENTCVGDTLLKSCNPEDSVKLLTGSYKKKSELQLVHEISSLSEVLYKRDALKNFSKFTDKLKKHSSGSALSKHVLGNFAKFTEKHFCGNLFFNKIVGCRSSHRR